MKSTNESTSDPSLAAFTACLRSIDQWIEKYGDAIEIHPTLARTKKVKQSYAITDTGGVLIDPLDLGTNLPLGNIVDSNAYFSEIISWFEENSRRMAQAENTNPRNSWSIAKLTISKVIQHLKWLESGQKNHNTTLHKVYLTAVTVGFLLAMQGVDPHLKKAINDSLRKQDGGKKTSEAKTKNRHDLKKLRDLILENYFSYSSTNIHKNESKLFKVPLGENLINFEQDPPTEHPSEAQKIKYPPKRIPWKKIYKSIAQDYCETIIKIQDENKLVEYKKILKEKAEGELKTYKKIQYSTADIIFSIDDFKSIVNNHPELRSACEGRMMLFKNENSAIRSTSKYEAFWLPIPP